VNVAGSDKAIAVTVKCLKCFSDVAFAEVCHLSAKSTKKTKKVTMILAIDAARWSDTHF